MYLVWDPLAVSPLELGSLWAVAGVAVAVVLYLQVAEGGTEERWGEPAVSLCTAVACPAPWLEIKKIYITKVNKNET